MEFDSCLHTTQVVFALLESRTGFGGGRLWRSTQYGDPETWEDVSAKMQGRL